jgi:hypothetical protein
LQFRAVALVSGCESKYPQARANMLDITSESTISLTQAARLLPPGRRARPVSLSCVVRWIINGATAPSGERVRLEAARVGGRWITSREALLRFAEALTPRLDIAPAPIPRTNSRRRQAGERADAELKRLGL